MSQITTHVLDTALGRPAAGVPVTLDHRASGAWTRLDQASTDADGRVGQLGAESLEPGEYRLSFDTAGYFAATGQAGFFPEVTLVFTVADASQHHVPLLLSPFAFSSYRGS